jgi:transcriptional regulator of acetoin/glycerol metabolism
MATASKIWVVPQNAESRHLDQIGSVARGEVPSKDMIEDVSASWRRCTAELLIDPESRSAPHIVTEKELRVLRESLTQGIFCIQEEIDRLYAIVRQAGYVVLLCNTDGVVIHHRGDEALAEEFKRWGIWLGGVWSEGIEGTNGIGTCIVEQRPIEVHADQHFRTRHIGLSCAGAPIFDPSGRLALVLDCSCVTSGQAHSLVLAATKVAARDVEERLFRHCFGHVWIIAAVPSDDSCPAVLLAVDSDMRVVGADRVARLVFALNDELLTGHTGLGAIFEHDRSAFRRNQEQNIPARFICTGQEWHALITPPMRGVRGWNARADLAVHSRPRISMLHDLALPKSAPEQHGGLSPARTHRIHEYVSSNLDRNISIEELAEMAGLSVHHFARAFKQTVGMPPHSYILQRRIEQAQQMLRTTKVPLSEIALSLGFSDQSHLARHFRRMTGFPPSAVRQ